MLSFSSTTTGEGGPRICYYCIGSIITTAGVSLLGLTYLSSISTSDGKVIPARPSTWNLSMPPTKFIFSDWTVWIGSAWILSRQYQPTNRVEALYSSSSSFQTKNNNSNNVWQFLSDFAFVGLLLFLRTPPPGMSSGDGDGDEQDEGKAAQKPVSFSQTRTQQFLQQIESNLGLTPKTHNRSQESSVDLELPLPRVLPVNEGSALSSFPSTISLQQQQQQQQQQQVQPAKQQLYLELLVHNVSHTDLVLSLDAPPPTTTTPTPEQTSSLATASQQPASSSSNSSCPPPDDDSTYCLCRPRFSAFDAYSRRVRQALAREEETLSSQLISFPRYERSDINNRKIQLSSSSRDSDEVVEKKKKNNNNNTLPIGFSLASAADTPKGDDSLLCVSSQERSDLRLRGRDAARLDDPGCQTKLNAVFFPLLGMLLPQWQARLEEKYGIIANRSSNEDPSSLPTAGSTNTAQSTDACKKVVILVSGVGSPRNWTHSMDGNSTEQCALLMERFIRTLYPDYVVVQVHSNTNIFRYDENISFVQNELLPCIQSWRDAHATGLAYPDEVSSSNDHKNSSIGQNRVDHLAFDPDWNTTMSVTLSFADGSPARNHAIQAALRPYKPTYFHCWQLKTFWHESKIVDSDIEVHSFEEMETLPPIDLTTLKSNRRFQQQQPMATQVVEEMKAFKAEMDSILKQGDDSNDIRSFWLRKTRKPVLAVLAVQMTKDGPVKLYRGTNMEVSMPTGSLCAERNVIGTALAQNPTLKRHHLKIIAVLSVVPPSTIPEMSRTTSTVSLASMSGGKVTSRSNSVDIPDPPSGNHSRLPRSTGRSSSGEWLLQEVAPPAGPSGMVPTEGGDTSSIFQTPPLLPNVATTNSQGEPPVLTLGESFSNTTNSASSATVSPSTTPVRRISLYQHTTPHNNNTQSNGNATKSRSTNPYRTQPNKRRTVVVVQSKEDLNPLRPCGACNEWLKKIAETNPYFQILTFTDKECNGVYCTPCAE